jgi:amino-acid N-acetyltransferase
MDEQNMSAAEEQLVYRMAMASDWLRIRGLLQANDLPLAGAFDHLVNFIVVTAGGKIVASAGMEKYGQVGLLRSCAVASDYRTRGVGSELVTRIMLMAHELDIGRVYLPTTTAEAFFLRRGFNVISRHAITPELLHSEEFKGACPASAILMMKETRTRVPYLSRCARFSGC